MSKTLIAAARPLAFLCAAVSGGASPLTAAAAEPAAVQSVIVTARRNPEDPPVVAEVRQALSRTPGAVSVVAAESYESRYAPALSDLLRDVPGVYVQKKWGGDVRLAIRGSGIGNPNHNRGTLLAQDGVPLNEADGYGDFQLIDPLIARYTEVYKGGNALRFGGALLGGAVNLVTPNGRDAEAGTSLRLDGGSWGTVRGHAELARAGAGWDLFAAATGLHADGWRAQSRQDERRLALNLGRSFGEDRRVGLILSGAGIDQQIPGSVTLAQALTDPVSPNPGNLANNYQRNMRSARALLQADWRLGDGAAFHGGLYGTWKQLDHPIFQVLDQQSRNWGAFGRVDLAGRAFGRPADLFAGAWLRTGDLDGRQWVNVKGAHGAQTAENRQNARGLDLFAEGRLFVLDELAVVAGGSYGRATRDYESFRLPGVASSFALDASKTYDWFAPRIGLLWQGEDGAQLFANLTRSVEPPNFSALAPTAAGFTPLQPQEAWTWEVGTRGRRGAFTWDLAFYRAELRRELLTFTVNSQIPASTFNAGPTVHQGIEAGLDWRIGRRLRLRQTYAWSDFRFRGDSQYGHGRLPVVPEHLYRAELRYEHPAGWFVAPSVEWSPADAWVDYANTLKSPAYTVLSLNAGRRLKGGVLAFVDVRNLTDVRYVSNFSAVTDARIVSTAVFYPGEGRSVFAGLSWGF